MHECEQSGDHIWKEGKCVFCKKQMRCPTCGMFLSKSFTANVIHMFQVHPVQVKS